MSRVEKVVKRLSLTKEMLQKKRLEVPAGEKKANPELRRLKKIVRRMANQKRRVSPAPSTGSVKEA